MQLPQTLDKISVRMELYGYRNVLKFWIKLWFEDLKQIERCNLNKITHQVFKIKYYFNVDLVSLDLDLG